MATTTIARSGQESTTRAERGLELYRERGNEFYFERGAWMVPSRTDAATIYEVRLGPVPSCECADHTYRGSHCQHIAAVTAAQAKSRVCSCCGERVLGRLTTEVTEEDELLSFYPGDVLCGTCIADGFFS